MMIDFTQSINQSIDWLNNTIRSWRRIHLLLPFPERQQPQLVSPHFSYSHCSTTRDADRWDPHWWPAVRGTVDDTSSSTAGMLTACSPPIRSTSYTRPRKRKIPRLFSSLKLGRGKTRALTCTWHIRPPETGRQWWRPCRRPWDRRMRRLRPAWRHRGVRRSFRRRPGARRSVWRAAVTGSGDASAERPVSPFWPSLLLLHRFLSAPMRLTDWTEPVVLPSSMPVRKMREKMFV